MLAGLVEKALKVHLKSAVGIFRKPDSADKSLVGALAIEKSAMNAAKVDEIERSSAHYEKRLKGVARIVFCGGNIVKNSALARKLELANTRESAVIVGGVSKKLRFIFNAASLADALLLAF